MSSDSPASSGNQKYTCSSLSTNLTRPLGLDRAWGGGNAAALPLPIPPTPSPPPPDAEAAAAGGGVPGSGDKGGAGKEEKEEEEDEAMPSMATTRRGCTAGLVV